MSDITKVKQIVENVESAEAKLALSALPEETKKELHETLLNIAKTPLEYQKIFSDKTSYMVKRAVGNNPKTIGAKISLSEQKGNCETVFSRILEILPRIKQQLLSMKGAGYFCLQEEVTKYKKVWLRKPSRGVYGDYGRSYDQEIKAKYKKIPFSDEIIDNRIQGLDTMIQKTEALLKNTQSLQVEGNMFAADNIEKIQEEAGKAKKIIGDIYEEINRYFPANAFQEKVWDKEFDCHGKFHDKVRARINEKSSSYVDLNRVLGDIIKNEKKGGLSSFEKDIIVTKEQKIEKGPVLIFTLPEIDELCKIQLGKIKEIANPKYEESKKQSEVLASTVEILGVILSMGIEKKE